MHRLYSCFFLGLFSKYQHEFHERETILVYHLELDRAFQQPLLLPYQAFQQHFRYDQGLKLINSIEGSEALWILSDKSNDFLVKKTDNMPFFN